MTIWIILFIAAVIVVARAKPAPPPDYGDYRGDPNYDEDDHDHP